MEHIQKAIDKAKKNEKLRSSKINRDDQCTVDSIPDTITQTVNIDPNVLRNNRVIMGVKNEPMADIFRVLRTNVLKQLRDNNWNSFVITSATPDAGKSFVSINLAIAIAMEGNQNVLIVDADLRRPAIDKYLGFNAEFGLNDYLENDVSIEKILINPGIENLIVMPGKNSSGNASELIASKKMTNLIKEIKSRYESQIVIFDLPPLFAADDAMLFMPYVDAALLVIEDGKNTSSELQRSMSILEQTNLLGLVLNKTSQEPPTYHYGYIEGTR